MTSIPQTTDTVETEPTITHPMWCDRDDECSEERDRDGRLVSVLHRSDRVAHPGPRPAIDCDVSLVQGDDGIGRIAFEAIVEATPDEVEHFARWLIECAAEYRRVIGNEEAAAAHAEVVREQIAGAVRWFIRRQDQQQNHVAIAAGMDPTELSRKMTSKDPFLVRDLADLADALDTTASAILAVGAALDAGEDPEDALRRYDDEAEVGR